MNYVYKITCKINGKVYIGITSKTIEKRWKEHVQVSKTKSNKDYNCIFKKAIRKYGEDNFKIEEIYRSEDWETVKRKEREFILKYNSFAFGENSNGYNSTFGGDGVLGYGAIPVVKVDATTGVIVKRYGTIERAICENKKGVYESCSNNGKNEKFNRRKYSNGYTWFYEKDILGKTDEEIKEMTYKKCNVLLQMDKDGTIIQVWTSSEQAANKLGITQSNINMVCNGYRRLAGEYRWCYYNQYDNLAQLKPVKTTSIGVKQYTMSGQFIKKYNSISEAESETKINNSKITMACKHKRNHAGNYIWLYENEEIDIVRLDEYNRKNSDLKNKKEERKKKRCELKYMNNDYKIIELNSRKQYHSISEIRDLTGYCFKTIREVCIGKRKEYCGNIWRYISEC